MSLKFKYYRCLWFSLCILYFAIFYLTINWFNSTRAFHWNPGFTFENRIPFIPYFIFGYMLVYLGVIGLFFLLDQREVFKKGMWIFFILTTVHFIFFLLVPVQMELRPALITVSDFSDLMVKLYYMVDMPYNCFPSLHVAYTYLGGLLLWNNKRTWAWVYIIASIIVSISVLLVKQHYLLDVIGGYLTTSVIYLIYSQIKKTSPTEG